MNQQRAKNEVSPQQTAGSLPTDIQVPPTEAIVAIIGYGTAGVNTLIALRTAGYKGKIIVFSNTQMLPYSPILTSYYVGGKKSYEECFPWSAEELASLDAEVLDDSPVTRLDPEAHMIYTSQGAFTYTKCVIATGATPVCWGFTGACATESFMLRTMDDAQRLKAAITKPGCKRVLVSGASMVALKTLEACLDRGLEVTLIGINPHVLDMNALPQAATRFEKALLDKGVQLKLGQTIKAVELTEDKAHPLGRKLEVTFSTGETEPFDVITVAHGMECNLAFVEKGSLQMDQGLVVDDFMRTSSPDVYAVGDVAQAQELISGEKRIVGNWKNAAVQGACAGRAIAAELAGVEIAADAAYQYKGSILTNTIAVNGALFISAGTMEVTAQRHVKVCESKEMTVVYVFEGEAEGTGGAASSAVDGTSGGVAESKKRLVGFNLVCDEDEAGNAAYDTGAMLTLRIEKPFACQPDLPARTSS